MILSKDDYTEYLLNALPDGRALKGKFDKNSTIYKFYSSFGSEISDIQSVIDALVSDFYWKRTSLLIPEWLGAKGFPNSCFPAFGSIEEERNAIIMAKEARGAQTKEDIENLFAIIGFDVSVYAGRDVQLNPSIAPDVSFSSDKEARNSIVIVYEDNPIIDNDRVFPVPFPWPFLTDPRGQISCYIRSIIPSTTQIVYSDQS